MCTYIRFTALPLNIPTTKLSVGDHIFQLGDTVEGWRSKLKGHEPQHVLPNDVEAQLQKKTVSEKMFRGVKYACDGYGIFVGNVQIDASWIASYPGRMRLLVGYCQTQVPVQILSPVWESGECLGCDLIQHQKVMGNYVLLE